MGLPARLIGLPEGAVKADKKEIEFTFTLEKGAPLKFVAAYGVVSQVTAALGRMHIELRRLLEAEKGTAAVPLERVVKTHVEKDRWAPEVVVQLVTHHGIPYTFAIPVALTGALVEQLRTESAKTAKPGSA